MIEIAMNEKEGKKGRYQLFKAPDEKVQGEKEQLLSFPFQSMRHLIFSAETELPCRSSVSILYF